MAIEDIQDRLKAIKLLPCPYCNEPYNIGQDSAKAWHITCFSCGMHGPVGENEFFAAAAWNALPRRTLRWSRKFPTQPGRYWHRNNYLAPHVTNVDTAFIKRAASVENVDNEEFAGPLPEPEGDG